jgi:phage terminase large subunit
MAKPSTVDARMVMAMRRYIRDPNAFVREVLRVEPDAWQETALDALANHKRVAIRAGHGVGKTALEAWAVLWFLSTRPFPKVPCTAPTRQQLTDVLWAEIDKWRSQSPLKAYFDWTRTRVSLIGQESRWFAVARTANRPENMAGFHEDHLLFVIDEASGVDDRIYETIFGALTGADNKLLLCGNPTRTSGVFYEAFHRDREHYFTMRVSALDSPRTDKATAEYLAKKYNPDSDVYRVRVLGEFPRAEPDTFIPLELCEAAVRRECEISETDELHIGVDVARFGDDETVIAARVGNKLVGLWPYTKQDTMVTAGYVIRHARDAMMQYNRTEAVIKIDDDGVGGGVTDRVNERVREEGLPFRIVPCHNGGKANDDEHYENWGTEAWAQFRDLLQEGAPVLPDDDKLMAQLSTRKYRMTSKSRIALERKDDMKKRGLPSPDRADAVVLAFANVVTRDPWTEWLKDEFDRLQNNRSLMDAIPETR